MQSFSNELKALSQDWPSKLIAYVLMPDHFHLIVNPPDGRIREFVRYWSSLRSFYSQDDEPPSVDHGR
jgi:REP element-mobilizing transposase RayT